jgi:hypothetical protein
MKKVLIALFSLCAVVPMLAHEGHDHKVMGTVALVQERRVDVKGSDAKTSIVMLDAKTKIVRGKAIVTAADIKTGDRIVVTATETKDKDGKTIFLAKEVLLGSTPAASQATQ